MRYNNVEISKMTIDDFHSIKNSLISEFDDFWTIQTFEEELKSDNSYYLVAKIDEEIVGFCGIKIIFDEADIMNVVTKKNKRNLGIATSILDNLILVAKEKNIHTLTLEVNNKNLAAIHLYEKFGFKTIAVRNKYYKNVDDANIMQLVL